MPSLTPKQQRFVEEYLIDLNATQAAIRAGYSAKMADRIGSQLLGKTRVSAAISEGRAKISEATGITVERVVREMARIGFMDVRKLVDDTGSPIPLHQLDDNTAAAIAGVEICRTGNAEMGVGEVLKFKVSDKNKALENLMRHLGGFERDNSQSKTSGQIDLALFFTELFRKPKQGDGA